MLANRCPTRLPPEPPGILSVYLEISKNPAGPIPPETAVSAVKLLFKVCVHKVMSLVLTNSDETPGG